jgi:hypothetical protein
LYRNYFELTLVTKRPDVNIIMPRYTTREILTHVLVESDITLSDEQNIYVIDSKRNKKNITLTNKGDYMEGEFSFYDLAHGICTLYVQVKDEVLNESPLVWRTFNLLDVMSFNELQIELSHDVDLEIETEENVGFEIDDDETIQFDIQCSEE